MAEARKPGTVTGPDSPVTQPNKEGQGDAPKKPRNKSNLSPRNRFVLQSLRQARRGCQLLAEQIQKGGEVSNEVATAAALLAGEASKCLS